MIDALLDNNRRYAGQAPSGLPATPELALAVVACMDARIDVYAALGLRPGQAHVIRNAGGIVTDDVIRSLAVSQRLLGTRAVMLIHHTRCGMLGLDDERFAADVERDTGSRPAWVAGGFADLDADVRDSAQRLQASPYLRSDTEVRGFVYDVDSGVLREVPTSGGE